MRKGNMGMNKNSFSGRYLSHMILRSILVFLAVICMITALSTHDRCYAAGKKIKTYYTGIDIQGTGFTGYTIRYKLTSYYLGKRVSYSKRREIGEIRNFTNKKATKTLSVSRATTRTCSISFSTVIPKDVVKRDINATIGGALSFSNTITISAGAEVPPHKSRSVYLQYKTTKNKYKYVAQKQIKPMYGKWKNIGKPFTRYNTSTTKVPALVL